MTHHFRILLSVAVALSAFSAASLHAQLSGPMEVSVVTGNEADGNEETTTLTGQRRQRFQYTIGSFKPVEIPGVDIAVPDMMGAGMAGMGDKAMGGGGMMGGGMSGAMGAMGAMMGGEMIGGDMMGGPAVRDGSSASQPARTITILAFVVDERQVDGRVKIELLVPVVRGAQGWGGMAGEYGGPMPGNMGGFGGGMMGMGREPSTPVNIGTYRRLSELADQTGAPSPGDAHLTHDEFQIVSQICRLKVWKADAVQAIQLDERTPEAGAMADKEQHLKQLLTEEFDVQLARQEIEVRTIEQRTAALKQEIERRRQAKDRVIDVQLGRIVLEALLGR